MKFLLNYPQNRLQYVNVKDKLSSDKAIECGITQESLWGPFLFRLHINDLRTTCSASKVTMFADATTVIKAGKKSTFSLARTLQNKLTINIDKCEAISFGGGRPFNKVIKDQTLDYKSTCKSLALHIDPQLSFKDHLGHVVRKLNKRWGLIHHVRQIYPRKWPITSYNSCAKSITTYGLLVYGRSAEVYLEKIDCVQRRILCAIFMSRKIRFIAGNIAQKQN